jgi:photosystem II stability/assembly factor-like uncharacterized protein
MGVEATMKLGEHRRSLRAVALAAVLVTASSQTVAAGQWAQIGPPGGSINALAADSGDPSTVYAATDGGGVFKSTDRGSTWTAMNQGLGDLSVRSLAVDPVDPSILYAGTRSGGVFKSTNAGATWTSASAGLPGSGSYPTVSTLAIDASAPNTVYAGLSYPGSIYESSDGAASWQPARNGLGASLNVAAIAIDPLSPATLYAATSDGLWKSSDGAGLWSQLDPADLGNTSIVAVVVDVASGAVYAARSQGIVKSDDGGESFEGIPGPANWYEFGMELWAWLGYYDTLPWKLRAAGAPAAVIGPTLAVATDGGVFTTSDDGAHWSALSNGLTSLQTRALLETGGAQPRHYVGTAGSGVFASDDLASWTWTSQGLFAGQVTAFAFLGPRTILGAVQGAGVMRSADGGASWSPSNGGGLEDASVAGFAVAPGWPGTVYAASDLGLFKSDNGGGSWTALSTGLPYEYVNAVAVDPTWPATLYAGGNDGVRRSDDGGAHWANANTGITGQLVLSLALDPEAPQTLYAGTYNHGIFVTTDGGATWSPSDGGQAFLANGHVDTIALDPSDPRTLYAGFDSGAVWKSSDGGASWQQMANGLYDTSHFSYASVRSLAIDPTSPSTVYATAARSLFSVAIAPLGVFSSNDGGATWQPLGSALAGVPALSVVVDPRQHTRVYVGSGGLGAFRLGQPPASRIRRLVPGH